MDAALVRLVRDRAKDRCEYCHLPAAFARLPFQIDHIIAEQHRGQTVPENLCFACLPCNKRKGPNIAGLDPLTGKLTQLFHPRRHPWRRHFRWEGPILVGRTAVGRTTVFVLDINDPLSVAVRQTLIVEGVFSTKV